MTTSLAPDRPCFLPVRMRPEVEDLEKGICLLADWEEPLMSAFVKAGEPEFDHFMHDREVTFEGVKLALSDPDLEALRWLAVEGFDLLTNGPRGSAATSPPVCADGTFYRALSLAGIADHDVRSAYHSLYFAPFLGALASFTSARAEVRSYASSPFNHNVPAPEPAATPHK